MARKKSKSHKKAVYTKRRRIENKGQGRTQRRQADVPSDRKDDNAQAAIGDIVGHVHGVLRTLLGRALSYIEEERTANVVRSDEHGNSQQLQPIHVSHEAHAASLVQRGLAGDSPVGERAPLTEVVYPNDGEAAIQAHPRKEQRRIFVNKANEIVLANEDELTGLAKLMCSQLRSQARMARAKFTSLFYLEELGALQAFDDRTTNMNKLPGKNLTTTRNRVHDLIRQRLVSKDPHSSRFQKISLTPLGKKTYEVLQLQSDESKHTNTHGNE